jgi:hypothetical protein
MEKVERLDVLLTRLALALNPPSSLIASVCGTNYTQYPTGYYYEAEQRAFAKLRELITDCSFVCA